MKISFKHSVLTRKTYCIELPAAIELESARIRSSIWLQFGIARVNPKDRYEKKEGRKVSENNMKTTKFSVDLIRVEGEYNEYVLKSEISAVLLKHKVGTNIIHFVDAFYLC